MFVGFGFSCRRLGSGARGKLAYQRVTFSTPRSSSDKNTQPPVLKMTSVSKTFIILKLSTILAFKFNINYIDSNCFEHFPF